MDSWQPFIPLSSKSYSKYGRIILAVVFVLAAILIAVGYDLNEKANFRCNPNTTIAADLTAKNFVETNCYMSYEKKHHRSLPVSRFVVINFSLILVMSVVYAGIANAKVEKFDTKSSVYESWQLESSRDARIFVFPLYIVHLLLGRVVPLVLFILLIHPAYFPVQFQCSWPPETSATNHNELSKNLTNVECVNPLGEKFETLASAIFYIDLLIATLAIIEVVYLLNWYRHDNDFGSDIEFCCMYLLEKRDLTIQQVLKRIRKTIREDECFLNVNFGSARSQYRGLHALADLKFRFLIHEEIEHRRRHEIYNVYLEQDLDSVKYRLVHLFQNTNSTYSAINSNTNNKIGNPDILKTYDKILIIGRAGIGKTTVAKAILYRWAKCKFLEDKVVIFLRFRSFRKNRTTILKKMLRQGKGIPSGSNFEELYKFILANPKKIVLIFDGLEDIKIDCESFLKEQDEDATDDDHEEPMSMFAIYVKLLKDKLLPGAKILTTSRRDKADYVCHDLKIQYQTKLELLGLSKHDIKEYAKGFCQSKTDVCAQIWRTIKNNPEFLSLCYIPEVCDLVCLTLKECFDHSKTDKDMASFIPKTITELWQRATRVIMWKTKKYYKSLDISYHKLYLISNIPPSLEDIMRTLKRLAKLNMESNEKSFQLGAEDISQRIISCGLLAPLPDGCYSFIYITMQEFLAACHIVDEIKDIGDVTSFIASLKDYLEKPGWHLVLQFVAGLLGEKIRKKEIDVSKDSICRSFLQWIRFVTPSNAVKNAKRPDDNDKRAAILVIKFLHEMQDDEIKELCANKLVGGGMTKECGLFALNIAPIDCMALFQFLVRVKNLNKLNLMNNPISDLGCLGLVKFIDKNVNLTSLNLTNISLSDKGIKIICHNLNAKIRRPINLSLNRNQITAEGIKSLCDAIAMGKLKLTNLSLLLNKTKVEGAEAFYIALTHSNCKITQLNLSGNELKNAGVNALCRALEHSNCKLVNLDLSNNSVEYEGIKSLCDLLKAGRCRLTDLALRKNNLTAHDIEPLGDALRSKNCTLKKLDLSNNKLSDAGAEILYHSLTDENSCKLMQLAMSNNEIKDRGFKILSDALQNRNCQLTELNLSSSKIGDTSVKHLCDAVKNENCKLTRLILNCIEISERGVQHLCDALRNKNCKLTNLQLLGNNITKQDVEDLNKSRSQCRSYETIKSKDGRSYRIFVLET